MSPLIDLLFMQTAIIITWYCPAIWLLRNELHTLHEYEADSRVLASGVKREEYQIFLIKKTVGARFATLSNCLNHSSLKKTYNYDVIKQTDRQSPCACLCHGACNGTRVNRSGHPSGVSSNQRGICRYAGGGSALQN